MILPPGRFFGVSSHEIGFGFAAFSARHYDPQHEQPWHVHERPTIFVQVSGDQLDESEGSEWQMPSLSVTYHPSGWRHRSRVGPRGAKGFNVEISYEWFSANDLRSADLGSARVLTTKQAQLAALSLLRVYVVEQIDYENLLLDVIAPLVDSKDTCSPTWLPKVKERIDTSFRRPISVAKLAESSGVHPVHLARVFRDQHEVPVSRYIQQLRIGAAVQQILEGDSIGSAALDAGFTDQFHFSRTLRAHYGYCPKALKPLRCCIRT